MTGDFLGAGLDQMIDLRHPLAALAHRSADSLLPASALRRRLRFADSDRGTHIIRIRHHDPRQQEQP